jgi:hypothetical protein
MKIHIQRALFGIAAMAFGWWLAGLLPQLSTAPSADPATVTHPTRHPPPGSAASGARHHAVTWSPSSVSFEELEGIESLRQSPALKLGDFIDGDGLNAARPLAEWIGLDAEETGALVSILHQAADARITWETAHLRSERLAAGQYRVKWQEPGASLSHDLQQALTTRFGPALARSIWIRGNLDRFAEPVPGWERKRIPEIDLHIIPRPRGIFTIRLTNGDWLDVRTIRIAEGKLTAAPRLDHLFQLNHESAEWREMAAAAAKEPTPVATRASKGMVFSPYNGKIIDVRGIPPGTLVADPTFPPEEGAYFRTPEE